MRPQCQFLNMHSSIYLFLKSSLLYSGEYMWPSLSYVTDRCYICCYICQTLNSLLGILPHLRSFYFALYKYTNSRARICKMKENKVKQNNSRTYVTCKCPQLICF